MSQLLKITLSRELPSTNSNILHIHHNLLNKILILTIHNQIEQSNGSNSLSMQETHKQHRGASYN